jgi:hypothetical protein
MSETNSSDKILDARCTDGKVAIGGGAQILGPQSADIGDIPPGVAIVASYPDGISGEKTPTWKAAAKEISPVSSNWRLQVYAVCARAAD